ncbi:MAG: alanine--tRNA ligase [Candidatus Niyogibacteria bacterium]|nr:alanine--tRNA ligase [Candidatus Niyogibacteria bacterium]
MNHQEIRKKFLDFFSARGSAAGGNHKIIASSSLISDDPSVLLTTAGMQQFKPYYLGEKSALEDFGSKNAVSIQKCFRTSDIDEVGDESHLTFFEMMGNFSFGGYWKKEAIQYGYDFITKEIGLSIEYVTVFDPEKVPAGDWRKNGVPFDKESYEIWKNIGLPEEKIVREGIDVFWGPTGNEGPCGPTTEIFIKNADGKAVEIWNIVFNEFYCDKGKKLTRVKIPGVDTGMGLERLAMILQGVKNIFETDLFAPIVEKLPAGINERIKRIFTDHIRAIAFLISDGVQPSNKEAGYVLRRLMRRLMVYGEKWALEPLFMAVIGHYQFIYPELSFKTIAEIYHTERNKFLKTLSQGLRELDRLQAVDAQSAFKLYESFGLPYEIIKERGEVRAMVLTREAFDAEFKKHQDISRAGAAKKFKGGLAETGAMEIKYHTATHLLNQALRQILGEQITQKGSNITSERLRFDFSHSQKLTEEEKQKVEEIVNQKIKEALPVSFEEMSVKEAKKIGALGEFEHKYGDKVKVYKIGDFSKEICGGPHVGNTQELGHFKIKKEEAVAAGVRRIKAVLE